MYLRLVKMVPLGRVSDVPRGCGHSLLICTDGGQMVLYRRVACPPEMTEAFNQDCKANC